jgi:very-short-patch-repair endonuclease
MEEIVYKLLTRTASGEEITTFLGQFSHIDNRSGDLMTLHETIVYLARYAAIKQIIHNLDTSSRSISEKVYRLLNDYEDVDCQHGNRKKFGPTRRDRNQQAGYYVNCGKDCACATESRVYALRNRVNLPEEYKSKTSLKRRKTIQERYGVDSYLSLPDARAAYDRKYPKGSPERSEHYSKIKQTNEERYGGMGLGSPVLREKIKETNLERYGVAYPSMNSSVSMRISHSLKLVGQETYRVRTETFIQRYGVGNPSQMVGHWDKVKSTCRIRYGEDFYLLTDEFKSNAKETCRTRYGVDNISQQGIPVDTFQKLNDADYLNNAILNNSVVSLGKELGVSRGMVKKYLIKVGISIPKQSAYERAIMKYLDDQRLEYMSSTRSIIGGKELDFYLPDYKLAIEINGLYWHSEKFKHRDYHLEKYKRCSDLGIRLLMINEDEWLRNQDVILGKITNMLGRSARGCGARKLKLGIISSSGANQFFSQYHIQGRTGSIVHAVAAYDNDELVGVMAFNKQRGTGEIELIRFCSNGKTYAGMFSKLFRYSIETFGFENVISFADLRYSEGAVYEKNGFVLENVIGPDYRYILGNKTFHKSSFTKKNIQKKFGLDIVGKTERELMTDLGIWRIYDCGKKKYRWRRKVVDSPV